MAEVTGIIGNEQVALNNAATEATLRLLLNATLSANKQTIESVSKIATKAGLDPAAVAAANTNLQQVGKSSRYTTEGMYALGAGTAIVEQGFRNVDKALSPLISQLIDGTGKASGIFGEFAKIGGPIGLVAELFGKLAKFQEDNLQTYQQLSQSGVNFGGSLTQMRMAAQNSYMTMEEFTRVMKSNTETFAKMGGTVNDGVMAFTKMSNSLLKSGAGDYLRDLGYTTEQVNNGLASYIAASGGRNKQELQNTAAITKGATEYLTQLDALSEITGKSREEQEKALKEASANAAYEAYLQTLDEEGKKKATLAMQNALATGGKAGSDLLKSQLLGLPPMTEAAQKLQALGPNVANGIKQMGDAVNDTRKTTQDVEKGRAAAQAGATKDMEKFGKVAGAMSFGTDSTSQAMMGLQKAANLNKQQNIKTAEDAENQMKDVVAKQKERAESEAANAVQTQKAVQETGQTIMSSLMPAIQLLTPMISSMARGFSWVIEKLVEFKIVTVGVIAALGTYWAAQKLQNILEVAKASKAAGGKGGVGGFLEAGKSVLGGVGALGSKTNPMYVILVEDGGLGDLLEKGKKGKKGGKIKTPKGMKIPKGAGALAEGAAGVGKGALKFAGKAAGVAGVLAGLGMAASDFMDVSDKEKKGEITKDEADKQKGGIVGEAGGGLAGAAGGALAGAAIGSVVPIIGTVIGGLIGGAIGGFGGGVLGKMGGEALMGPKDGAKEIPKHADGGIATKPTMGIFGEAGPEALIPLNKIPKMTDSAMDYAKMDNRTSSMDKIKDMLGSLGSKIPLVGAAQQAGGAMSSMLGNIGGSKSTENLTKEIETLNKNTIEMVRQLRDIADHTKQGVSATKSLGGNLFNF